MAGTGGVLGLQNFGLNTYSLAFFTRVCCLVKPLLEYFTLAAQLALAHCRPISALLMISGLVATWSIRVNCVQRAMPGVLGYG